MPKNNYSPQHPSSPSPLAFLGKQAPLGQVYAFVKGGFSFDLEAWLSFCYRFHFKSVQLLLLSWNATLWEMWALGLTVILSLGWQLLFHYAFTRETPQAVHAESWVSGGKQAVDATSSWSRWWLGKDMDCRYHWLQMPWCLASLYSRLQYWCSWPCTGNRSITACTSHCSWSLQPPNLSICQRVSVSSPWDQHFIEAQNSELNDREDNPGATVKDFHTHKHTPYEPLRLLHHLNLWHASQLTGWPHGWWVGERLWTQAWRGRTRGRK